MTKRFFGICTLYSTFTSILQTKPHDNIVDHDMIKYIPMFYLLYNGSHSNVGQTYFSYTRSITLSFQ